MLNAIRTFGANIRDLELPEDIGDGCPNDKVEPVALMPDLHLLPGIWTANIGYGKLLDELQARLHLVAPTGGDPSRIPNLVPVAYGWRLSNRYNGQRLKTIVEPALSRWRAQGAPYAETKVIFICHSMGGLVARCLPQTANAPWSDRLNRRSIANTPRSGRSNRGPTAWWLATWTHIGLGGFGHLDGPGVRCSCIVSEAKGRRASRVDVRWYRDRHLR